MRRIILIMCIFSCIFSGCQRQETEVKELEEIQEEVLQEEQKTEESIFVHVCGEVRNPGVYELNAGSRVYEAIEAAGGITEDAASDNLNQAQFLEDGQQIVVLSIEEVQNQGERSDGKISLNHATKEELMTLKGIGESRAEAILEYRESNGGFRSLEELKEIEGIKEGIFQNIKDHVKVS